MKKENICEWIILCDSLLPWNSTTIMVWVHGDERAWIEALNELIDNLTVCKWKVYFIYANLKAIEKNVRYTEKNLNRCFLQWITWNKYEEKRAIEIMNILDNSDYLLDIHNTESLNSSIEMLITNNTEYVKYFNFDKVITNIDNISKWWSDWYMDNIWKKWFCIECWSLYFWDREKCKNLAKDSIINFLKMTWNVYWDAIIYDKFQHIIKMYNLYITKTDNFKLSKHYKDFDKIDKWELIAIDGEEKIISDRDSIVIFAHNRDKKWEEWFYLWYIV